MTHAYGYRRRTRHKFKKGFRQAGAIHISKTLTTYKRGEIVDIAVDGAIHKGMPYKYYHGKTGRVFNVNPRSLGVIINKQVRNRIIPKRIHVRIEHIKKSTSREDFLKRVRHNDKAKHEAKKTNTKINTKRIVAQPHSAYTIDKPNIEYHNPKIFVEII
jgi:large subunit ribosomal protein L21e